MSKASAVHHGNLRTEIIVTALGLVDNGGIASVGIRKVARNIGVAHSAPANHFKNLRELMTALAVEAFADLGDRLETVIAKESETLRESVHVFADTVLEYGLAFPNRYQLLWRKDCVNPKDINLNQAMDRIYDLLIALLQSELNADSVDVESRAIALWSMVHGYVSLRLDGNLGQGTDSVTGVARSVAVIDVLLDGIGTG